MSQINFTHSCRFEALPDHQGYLSLRHVCHQRSYAILNAQRVNQFNQRPLDNSRSQIRLLMVWLTGSDELHGHLHHFDLEDAPPYIALSYMWGKGTEQKIVLDGHIVSVLPNLYSFLHVFAMKNAFIRTTEGLRHRFPMWLWTDRLCIDQASEIEKSHQIPLMAEIYPKATLVIIWLGTNPIDREAFKTIKIALNWKATRGVEGISFTEEQAHAVHHLYNNGYWDRVWVVQEVKMARQATLWCGWEELSIDDLMRLPRTKIGDGADAYHVEFMLQLDQKQVMLARMCENVADRECTDPRDRVYGMRSLLDPSERTVVDYKKSVTEVFFDLTAMMIKVYALRPINTGDFKDTPDDALNLLWDVGVAMGVFRDPHGLGISEARSCFQLVALFPDRLKWTQLDSLIVQWLPAESRTMMFEIGRLLENVAGRAEFIHELREAAAEYKDWWTCDEV